MRGMCLDFARDERVGRGENGVVIAHLTVAETASTNDDLAAMRATAHEGLWLRAARQTGGRGRQGRLWVSPVGNLHASTLVRLQSGDPAAPTLALVAAVGLHEALALFAGDGLTIKWPNDLVVGGAKIAGILLERFEDIVIVGCGANLAHSPDLPDRPTTSIAALAGTAPDPDTVARTLAEAFARWLSRWRGEGLAPVIRRWGELAHPPGTALRVGLPDGETLDGLFDGLDATGALRLRLADGTRRVIHAGDVFLVRD